MSSVLLNKINNGKTYNDVKDYITKNRDKIHINIQTNSGDTPLTLSISLGLNKITNLLLNEFHDEIDINHTNKRGNTALHIAVIKDNFETVEKLSSFSNINLSIRNNKEKTPFNIAEINKNYKIASFLENIGGESEAKTVTTEKKVIKEIHETNEKKTESKIGKEIKRIVKETNQKYKNLKKEILNEYQPEKIPNSDEFFGKSNHIRVNVLNPNKNKAAAHFHDYVLNLARGILNNPLYKKEQKNKNNTDKKNYIDIDTTPTLFLLEDAREELQQFGGDYLKIPPSPNAYFYVYNPSNKKEIHSIIINRELINIAENEDQLAYIIAHELGHYFLKNQIGLHKNSETEELSADLTAVRWIYYAGYDPKEAIKILEKIYQIQENIINSLQYKTMSLDQAESDDIARQIQETLFSEHPGYKTRLIAASNLITELEQQHGDISERTPKYPNNITESQWKKWKSLWKAAAATIRNEAYYESMLEYDSYEEDDDSYSRSNTNEINYSIIPETKTEITPISKELKNKLNTNKNISIQEKINNLLNLTEYLNKNYSEKKLNEYGRILANQLLLPKVIKKEEVNSFIVNFIKKALSKKIKTGIINTVNNFYIKYFGYLQPTNELPQIKSITENLNNFIDAKNYKEAYETGKIIQQNFKGHVNKNILSVFDIKTFTIPENKHTKVPWEKFINWFEKRIYNKKKIHSEVYNTLAYIFNVKNYDNRIENYQEHVQNNEDSNLHPSIQILKHPLYKNNSNFYLHLNNKNGKIAKIYEDKETFEKMMKNYFLNNLIKKSIAYKYLLNKIDHDELDNKNDNLSNLTEKLYYLMDLKRDYYQSTQYLTEEKSSNKKKKTKNEKIKDILDKYITEESSYKKNFHTFLQNKLYEIKDQKDHKKIAKILHINDIGFNNIKKIYNNDNLSIKTNHYLTYCIPKYEELTDQYILQAVINNLSQMNDILTKTSDTHQKEEINKIISKKINPEMFTDIQVRQFLTSIINNKILLKDYLINILNTQEFILAEEVKSLRAQYSKYKNENKEFDINKHSFLMLDNIREILEYKKPETMEELRSIKEYFIKNNISSRLLQLETYIYITNNNHKEFELKNINKYYNLSEDLEEYHPFDYKNMGFNNHLNESINNWKNWPEEINEQINTYLTLVKNQYFSELSAPVDTLKNLINRNNNLPLTERLKNLETFLEEKNRNSHPDIRKLFMESYANSLYEYMNGPDDNSDEYIQKIKPYIDSYKDKLIANDNYELSYMLGNKLISQRKLSYFLKPEFKITKNLLEDDKNIAKITKILLLYSDSNKANANSIIDFLTQPLTYKTAHTLYATFVKNAFSLKGQMSDTTTYYKYNAEKDIYEAVQDEIILDNEEEIIDHINRNASPEKLSLYHKNFWQADIKARSPIINRFIYSSISDYELNVKWEKYFNKCMEYIINMEDPNKEHIINIAHSYLMAREDYARKTFLSTAVVSNETLSEKSISLGHILNKLLSQTPSGLKVLQAIDSSSDVGENIKKDIKFSKSNKDSIPKWEIWEMLDDKTILPETEREKISHLYHSYKASFWLTCIIENKEGQKKAVQILNPNERNVAKNEFRIFTQSLENLKETTSRKLVPIVKDMIEVAKNNAENETNTKTGYEQAKTAHSIYDNTTITIGNHKFTFYVTPWESISKNSKVLEEAPGLAVDELPNETKEDIAYKKNVALAKLSKEFSIIFTGGNFDYDRHSKQQNIYKISEKETMIWLYDHGCMSLTPPKEEEKEILGELTYKIFKSFEKQNSNNKENDNVVDVIQHITEELKKEDKLTRYIVKIKKALLALNDFMKYLTQEEIIDALMVGIKSAALDKSIKKGFENHASQSEIEKFSMLQNKLIPMSLVNNSNIKSIKKEKSDFKTIIEYQQTNDGQYISIPINIKFERPEENEKNNNDSKDNQDDKAMSPITSVIFESALDYQHE